MDTPARRQVNRRPPVTRPRAAPAGQPSSNEPTPPVALRRGLMVVPSDGPRDQDHLMVVLGHRQQSDLYATRYLYSEDQPGRVGVFFWTAEQVIAAAACGIDTSAPAIQAAAARLARVYRDAHDTFTPVAPSADANARTLKDAYERVARSLGRRGRPLTLETFE